MKRKPTNPIDLYVERLSQAFLKIKDFETLQDSEEGRKVFDVIVQNMSNLENFQSLYLNYYLPATNKAIAETWNQIANSKYKDLLNISREDLKDNLHETIRRGYVCKLPIFSTSLK